MSSVGRTCAAVLIAGVVTMSGSSAWACKTSCTPRGCDCTFRQEEARLHISKDGVVAISGKLDKSQIGDFAKQLLELQAKIDAKQVP